MRYLIELYLKYRFWLIFLMLEVISMVTLFKFNKYQGSVYFTTANTVSGAWYSFTSGISSFFDMQAENERLEHENEMLRKRLNDLRSGMKEEDNTVDMLTEKNRNLRDYHYIGAHIINSTLNRATNVLTIDRGEEDGVKESAGVVCSSGVVGIVYKTSAHYAMVVPLINEKSVVSCKVDIDSTRVFGTLQWQMGSPQISYLNDIPRHIMVKEGMEVETNGFSDIFPENIPVGKVVKVNDSSDGLSYSLTVKLYTDFAKLRNVSVIADYTRSERKLLEEKVDSLINDK